MHPYRIAALLVATVPFLAMRQVRADEAMGEPGLVLKNELVRYTVSSDGRNLSLVDQATGRDCLLKDAPQPFAQVHIKGAAHPAVAVEGTAERFVVRFKDTAATATFSADVRPRHLVFRVLSVEGGAVEQLQFARVSLDKTKKREAKFASCLLALNLRTNATGIPQDTDQLFAMCYPRFGFAGAAAAIIACPAGLLRDVMKEAVHAAPEIPRTDIGGPFAMDSPANRESYLMDVNQRVTEANADEWIELARKLGIRQLDFHMGLTLRFGDYEPDPQHFPNGLEGLRKVVDKLHAAGMKAGFHTYAHFLAKNSRWVSPVPDPRLARAATFTLAEDLTADALTVPVVESTKGISTNTGFLFRNSVTLHVGDELIVFRGVRAEPPFEFLECQRGAHGTKVSAHIKGTPVYHLEELFGLFCPDGDSTLFEEVAARTAEVYNHCGFDMIYMDALDGAYVAAGKNPADSWHYVPKFAWAVARRLNKPALFEMSTFTHHLWYIRSRMGAWDVPARAAKRFIDLHCLVNRSQAGCFLPATLGWWGILPWGPVQPERTMPDDLDYLLTRCIGNDYGMAMIVGISPRDYAESANVRRLGDIVHRYEQVRLGGEVPEQVKARLASPGEEFRLESEPGDQPRFRRIEYLEHKVTDLDGERNSWTVQNRFGEQPLRLRIEALMSAEAYDSPQSTILADFDSIEGLAERDSNPQVDAKLERSSEAVKTGTHSARLRATNGRPERLGSWTMFGRKFSPPANVVNKGLGLWVHGDGKGALLNVQLKGAKHTGGAPRDSYVQLDFEGWRYFELIEPESDALVEYDWPYSGHQSRWAEPNAPLFTWAYPTMHYWVDYSQIDGLNLWLNDLPPGESVECLVSPIKALPLKPGRLNRPVVGVNGQRLTFPAKLESGAYLEVESPSTCRLYDSKGNPIGEIQPNGEWPVLRAGTNQIRFECDRPADLRPRARVTVITLGDVLP